MTTDDKLHAPTMIGDDPTPAELERTLEAGYSDRGHAIGLYLEYLEEASFLYEQRLELLDDPELTWLDLEDFESRFEAHIDGLVVGKALALAVCRQQALGGDPGALHTAVCVYCRRGRKDLLKEVLNTIDPTSEEQIKAVGDALGKEMPDDWHLSVVRLLGSKDVEERRVAISVVGHRRLGAGRQLLEALEAAEAAQIPRLIWALGRLRDERARLVLYEGYLQHGSAEGRSAAALALLRIGEQQTLHYCTALLRAEPWTAIPMGLAGGYGAFPFLQDLVASSDTAHPEALLALGLLGHVGAVDVLLKYLTDERFAGTAALALNLITGAHLYEEAFVPDEIDEDALFEEELEKLRRGEPLTPPGEQPPGTMVSRLSMDQRVWQAWWIPRQDHFQETVRYRNGKPCSPACLLETLASEQSPRQVRQWAYEELVIRYGLEIPFETEMLVGQQRSCLAACADWIAQHHTSFREGAWYFKGRLTS